jgi:phytoene desaturase
VSKITLSLSFVVKMILLKNYNSYKGNAEYIVANRVPEAIKSKKVGNLYFTGQLTVPGPGVPPALISGKLVSDLINKQFLKYNYDNY